MHASNQNYRSGGLVCALSVRFHIDKRISQLTFMMAKRGITVLTNGSETERTQQIGFHRKQFTAWRESPNLTRVMENLRDFLKGIQKNIDQWFANSW